MDINEKLEDLNRRLIAVARSCPSFVDCALHEIQLKLTCAVDRKLVLHALRCAQEFAPHRGASEGREQGEFATDQPLMRPLEHAVLAPSAEEVRWQTVSPPLYNPFFPVLAEEKGGFLAGATGLLEESPYALKTRSFSALGLRLGPQGAEGPFVLVRERVMRSFGQAAAEDGSILVLTTCWFPPPALVPAITLRLLRHDPASGTTETVADPVPGTDAQGNSSTAWDLHVARDGVHVVYAGIQPGGDRKEPHLWQVILDRSGHQANIRDHGLLPARPLAVRALAGPSGWLHALVLFPRGENGKPGYRLVPLEGESARPGPAERFVIDPLLDVHAVQLEGTRASYLGPASPLP